MEANHEREGNTPVIQWVSGVEKDFTFCSNF